GDMGAEIVKIEPPGQPDPLREWGKARYEGRSLWWPVQSRNKKCCTLDLRVERGQALLLELVEHADVLVENFRPGTLERWNRGPGGTGLQGVAPSNVFESADGKLIVIAANADNVFRRLCTAMERPELADDPRFATHLARGENQEEIEGIVAEWAKARRAAEIDRVLNEAGVICGPIYTVADIFEDPQFQAREMLLTHVDPEFGEYVGPGIVPKFSGTPCE